MTLHVETCNIGREQLKWNNFVKQMSGFMRDIDTNTVPTVILGDFNMKSIMSNKDNFNSNVTNFMYSNYNMTQFIENSTTNYNSTLDLLFSNKHVITTTIWNHWSDHRIIAGTFI